MQLRKHPFMSQGWVPLWPPEWKWTFGRNNTHPIGEVGVLEDVQQSTVDPNVCFLTMSHNGATYIGRLHFDHQWFSEQIRELLAAYYGRPLAEIAQLDIP